MDFERGDILKPILDHLAANDQTLFSTIPKWIVGPFSVRSDSTPVVAREIAEALKEELTKRGDSIVSEIENVLTAAYIDDFESLRESLKAELIKRLESPLSLANSEFLRTTQFMRTEPYYPDIPSETALSEHVERLKPKWVAKIDLFCVKLHDSQKPRLFLKAGEVFAGNRAARKIFTAAKQSLDIIDTWFGPAVFDMLEVTQPSVKIRLISDKAKNPTKQAYNLFNQQFGQKVEFRVCDPKDIHDRFIIVDGQEALHFGASIKDLGKSDSLIDSALLEPHKQRFEELWLEATPVT